MGGPTATANLQGLENFNLNANGTLEVYQTFTISGTAAISGTGSNAPTIIVDLPSGTGNGQYTIITANSTTIANAADLARKARFTVGGNVASPFSRVFNTGNGDLRVNLTMTDTSTALDCARFTSSFRLQADRNRQERYNVDFRCRGGNNGQNEYSQGFELSHFFGHNRFATSTGAFAGSLLLRVDNLSQNVNTDSNANDHGMTFDATGVGDGVGSFVTRGLAVFNQSYTTGTLRQVQVRASGKAAIYAKATGGVYVGSASPLVFKGSNVNNMRGIHAIAGTDGSVQATNEGSIGFVADSTCTANCGSGHRGIFVEHTGVPLGTGETRGTQVFVTNAGAIDFGAATNSVAMYVSHTSNSQNITVGNSGTVSLGTGGTLAQFAGTGTSAQRFTLNLSGTAVAPTLVTSASNASVDINVTGGFSSGAIDLKDGNDNINITGGVIDVGSSANFGGGNNIVTVGRGGAFGATSGTTLTGLDDFTANAGSAMRVYLGDSFNATTSSVLNLGASYVMNGTGDDALRLEIYLPSGYALGAARTTFNLITAASGTVASIADISNNVRLFSRGSRLEGTVRVTKVGDVIRLEWDNDLAFVDFVCSSPSTNVFNCEGGTVSDVEDGLSTATIFTAAGITSTISTATFNFDNFTADVGSKSNNDNGRDGHAIAIDGTANNRVTGNVTVNHQVNTASADKVDVFVRGNASVPEDEHAAALYVKSAAGVTVNNNANLLFHRTDGSICTITGRANTQNCSGNIQSPYDSNLAGITAVSAGAGSVAITNRANIGFSETCTVGSLVCGAGHRGINVNHGGSGTVTITSSGDLSIYRGAGIYVNHTNRSGNIVINSSGDITMLFDRRGSSHSAVEFASTSGSSSQTATINLTDGVVTAGKVVTTAADANFNVNLNISGADVTGALSLGRGDDTVNISGGGKFTLTPNIPDSDIAPSNRYTGGNCSGRGCYYSNNSNPFDFGGGNDRMVVGNGGELIAGNATDGSDQVELNGLESLTFNAGSTLSLFMDSDLTATYTAWETAETNLATVTANSSSTPSQIAAAQRTLDNALRALNRKAFKVQGNVAFNGTGNQAPIIRLHVPSGFVLETQTDGSTAVKERRAFAIMVTERFYRTVPRLSSGNCPAGSTLSSSTGTGTRQCVVARPGLTVESLADMANSMRVIEGDQILSLNLYLRSVGFDTLRVGWAAGDALSYNRSEMNCVRGGTIVNCSGGRLGSAEFNSGISLVGIFERLGIIRLEGNTEQQSGGGLETEFTVNLDNLVGHVNLTGDNTHGIYMDGLNSLSEVRGNLTVNNQVRTADINKKDVYVRASERVGLFVNSARAVTVNNAGNIFFKLRSGSTTNYSNNMVAIEAVSSGSGRVRVTNSGRIGFEDLCISTVLQVRNCGTGLVGIAASQHSLGATIVTNSGSINVGDGNNAIFIQHVGGTGTVTINNSGNIIAERGVMFSQLDGVTSDRATINFSGGVVRTDNLVHTDRFSFEELSSPSVDLSTLDLNAAVCNDSDTTNDTDACKVDSGFVGTVTVNVTGGLNVGNLAFNRAVNSDDTVNVTGGILVLPSVSDEGGVSEFGAGNDTLNVSRGGTLVLGSAYAPDSSTDPNLTSIPTGSDNIQFSGLESFNLSAGATLRLYMDSNFNAARINSTVTISAASNIEINLPSGYTIGDKTAFTLIDATILDAGSVRILSNRVRIFDSEGVLYQGTITVSQSGEDLQIAWSSLTEFTGASSMNCSYTNIARSIQCNGGAASDSEFTHGMNLTRIFNDVSFGRGGIYSNGTYNGNLTINLTGLTAAVNTSGVGHGIAIEAVTVVPDDPTDSNTTFTTTRYVSGDLTVNNQVTGTRREVQVRGGSKAALYVASAANVTVTNAADLRFKTRDTGLYDDSLTGLFVSTLENTTGSVTVVNSGDIGFASSCVPQCGAGHIGISIGHSASGDVSVTNVGDIFMGNGSVERLSINIPGQAPITSEVVTANTAILLAVPYGDNVTVTNTGDITGGEYSSAVGIIAGASAQNRVINFNSGEVKTDEVVNAELALGGTTTVNVNGGTVEGRFNFGGALAAGAETVNVNAGGTLVITNGESKFGAGTDAIVVSEGGRLDLGNDAVAGSDGVTISGLETFTLNAKSTLGVYLDSGFNGLSMATSVAINGGNDDAPTLIVNLPVGYDLAARPAAFTLIGVTGAGNTVTVESLAGLAKNVRLMRGMERFKVGNDDNRSPGRLTFSLDGNNLQVQWTGNLQPLGFAEIAEDVLGGDKNQTGVALALANAAGRSNNPNLYRDLFAAVENSGDPKNLESSLAPIYSSLVQSSWFAGHRFVNEVMENFCSRHRVTGLKKLTYAEHAVRNKRTSCGRADVWSSVTRKSDDDGAVGFEENSLFNFGGFWSRGLNKHFIFSGAVSYGLVNHESNRGGESYGHRVSGAAVLHLTQNGALQRNGFIASAGATVSGSIFDVDRDTVGGGAVTSDISMVSYGLHARGGLRLTLLGDMFIEPRGGISFSQLFLQDAQEEVSRRTAGTSDFNLAVDESRHSFTSLHGSVMMGDQWQLSNSMQMEPSLKAGLTYIATGTDIDVSSRFLGDLNEQNFIAYNNDMDKLFVDISTGFLLFGDEEMLGSLDYEGMFSLIGKTRRHSARLRLSF